MAIIQQFNNLIKNFKNFKNVSKIKINKEEDIKKIPFTTREDLKKWTIKDCPQNSINIYCTSGTTGRNIYIYVSKESEKMFRKRIGKGIKIAGWKKGDIILNLLAYAFSSAGKNIDWTFNTNEISVMAVGEIDKPQKLTILIDAIKRLKPVGLISTPDQLYDLFSKIGKKNSIKKCICVGERLTPEYRNLLEKTGGVKVYEVYGSVETGVVSFQKNNDMLVLEDGLYIEILKENGEIDRTGEGEIIITDLYNFSTPIIRYRVGDKVSITEKNGEKYIKILGRKDKYTKICGEVVSKNLLIKILSSILTHPNFFIIIDKDKNYEDIVTVNIPRKDFLKRDKIEMEFKKIGISSRIKATEQSIPQTVSGKFIHIIDKRKLKLKNKELNW